MEYYAAGIIRHDLPGKTLPAKFVEPAPISQPLVRSGAVFGILFAFGYLFPNNYLFILPIPFPIKAKYFIGGYILLELYMGIKNSGEDNVAHWAHLGGALFGYLLAEVLEQTEPADIFIDLKSLNLYTNTSAMQVAEKERMPRLSLGEEKNMVTQRCS